LQSLPRLDLYLRDATGPPERADGRVTLNKLHLWSSVALLFAVMMFAFASSAQAEVEIHAHRGGSNVEGKATFPESSMPGFKNSLAKGWVIEFDLQVTSDGVPVVMHDVTLDRTTNCTGRVDEHTIAELGPCRIDRLGSGTLAEPLGEGDPLLEPIPTFDQMIALLEETGGKANIEVKDLAGIHPDLVTGTYSRLEASGIPSDRIIVQNFIFTDLSQAKTLYPGVATSLLAPSILNDSYLIETAAENGIDWVSPQWPISAEFVARAREAGKKIVPYTIDDATGMREADALGVDALITNDPTMADRLVGLRPPPPPPPPPVSPKLSLKLSGKTSVRPGGSIRVVARISNVGDGSSRPEILRIGLGGSGLIAIGGDAKSIPALAAGSVRTVSFRLKAKARTRKFGARPVNLRLAPEGQAPIKKVRIIRIKRPSR